MLLLGSVRFDAGTSSLSRRTKTPFVLPQKLAKSVFVTGTNQSHNLLPYSACWISKVFKDSQLPSLFTMTKQNLSIYALNAFARFFGILGLALH